MLNGAAPLRNAWIAWCCWESRCRTNLLGYKSCANNDSTEVVNPWALWIAAVPLSGGARIIDGKEGCRWHCCFVMMWKKRGREGRLSIYWWGSGSVTTAVICKGRNGQFEDVTVGTSKKLSRYWACQMRKLRDTTCEPAALSCKSNSKASDAFKYTQSPLKKLHGRGQNEISWLLQELWRQAEYSDYLL